MQLITLKFRSEIVINDTVYAVFEAILFYIYHEEVKFAKDEYENIFGIESQFCLIITLKLQLYFFITIKSLKLKQFYFVWNFLMRQISGPEKYELWRNYFNSRPHEVGRLLLRNHHPAGMREDSDSKR